ncbi:anthranilate phosphoribosyltransferase [Tistrella sp.]|uniref:anthranilate phosphoribosyltransferase n=1 Tax=Tistrella sp. TaxID=2024861 RepID=UPI000C970EF1|nr:anthranilate phosphoribosyltransferase [Tistrella sp.]MAD35758.1 anthranilate phosphoribosyltransferase [Tistrella sp.]
MTSDTTSPDFRALIARAADGHALTREEARQAFRLMMGGEATPAQIGGFLMALRVRGETVEEITAGAEGMRAKATTVRVPAGAIDTCGTGGDARGTYNISTAAALIVAACGVPVAKHGNRALSSKSGSADVLKALGLNIEADLERVERAGRDAGFCFLMAPRHHAAMLNVAGPRVELGTRTIFNLLGPLANPAGATRQLIGVFAERWVEPVAQVLRNLGSERAWVVHGRDGLDEITVTDETAVSELKDGKVTSFTVSPEMFGLTRHPAEALKGGDAQTNAAAILAMLDGTPGALRDIALLNAGAALLVAGVAGDVGQGIAMARDALDQGRAKAVLDRVIAITNGREG